MDKHTTQNYPCGCSASGPGDVPDYCPEHGVQVSGLHQIIGHLGAAKAQRAPSDDSIIAGHIEAALLIAEQLSASSAEPSGEFGAKSLRDSAAEALAILRTVNRDREFAPRIDRCIAMLYAAITTVDSPGEPSGDGWIDVADKMPPTQHMVIIATPTSQRGRVDYGFRDMVGIFNVQTMMGWEDVRNFGCAVTHWRPMPEPPRYSSTKGDQHGT